MPTLAFAIEADYQKVIKLREEIASLEKELTKLGNNASPDTVEKLESKMASLQGQLGKLVDKAAQAGAKFEEQGVQMKGSMEMSSGATKALLAQLDELSRRSISMEKMKDAFREQIVSVSSLTTQISRLSNTSDDYTEKAARMKAEIEGMSSALRKDVGNGLLGSDEQNQRLTAINAKIREYASTITQASATAQAAYELQQNKIIALSSEIETLKQRAIEAAAAGETGKITAINDQIVVLNAQLKASESSLAKMGEQAKQANKALDDVGNTQKEMRNSAQLENGFFGNIIDKAEELKEKVSDAFGKLKEKAVAAFEPIKNKANEASDRIAEKWSDLSNKMGLGRLNQALHGAGEKIKEYKDKVVNAATGHGKFQESLGNMKDALNGLPIPLGNTLTGIKAMTAAMWKMCATPVGAVLAAIALGLQAVYQFFTKSAEGQRAFAKITAYTSSLLQSATDIVITLGKWIYHAFADNNGPLNDFGKSLVKTFSTAVKTVAELFGGLGKTIKGVLNLDLDTIWDGLKQIGTSVVDAGKTIVSAFETNVKAITGIAKTAYSALTDDSLHKELSRSFNDAGRRARESAQNAERELQAQKEMAEAKQKSAELDIEIAKKRDKIYTLTGKERAELAREVKLLQQQKYDGQIAAQRKLLAVQTYRNRLHTTSLQDIAKERDLQTQLYQLQAQQISSTRMMTRMESMGERKAEQDAKNAAKRAETEANKARNKSNAVTSANEKLAEVERANLNARVQAQVKMEQQMTDARIAAMQDGADKVQAEKKRELEKELEQLDGQRQAAIDAEIKRQKQEWDAQQALVKAQGGVIKSFEVNEDDASIKAINDHFEKVAKLAKDKYMMTEQQAQLAAMRSYLKEYGTYQQQKLAIAEEYADKIAKATTEGERMALSASRDKALADVDLREFKDSINWEQVFGNLQYQTKEQLEKLKGQLRDYLNSSDLGADEYKSVAEQIDKINSAIVDEEQRHANILNWELPTLGEKKKLMMEAEESQKRLNDLTQRQIGLNMAVTASRTSISANLQRMGFNVNPGEVTSDNAQSILSKVGNAYGTDSKQYKEVAAAMDKLTNEERKLTDATKKQSQAAEDYKNKQSALSKYLGDFRNKLKEVSEAFEHVNKNLQSLPDLTQALGLDSNSGLGKAAQGIADTSNYAMGAMQDFASGNYLGAAAKGINAVNSLGETLGFWSNSNKADVEEENNRLVEAGKNLEVAMDKLTKQMQKGSASEAAKTYEEAKKMLKTQSENERAKMQNNARMYDGGHSLNYDFNEMFEGSSLAKRLTQFLGVSVRTLQDITSLDATKLEKLTESDKGRQLWKELNDMLLEAQDDGNYNGMADDLRNYITNYGKEAYEKLEEQFKSFVTGTSLDSFKDSFKSALADMDRSSQDFASDFTKQLTQSVINAQIEKKFNEKMTRLYDRWNTAVSGDDWIDENELNDLRQQESELVQEMIAERNRIREAIGYDAATTASSGSFQGMSQDTGNELNGRFTALQAAGERIDAATAEQTKNILQMNVTLGELAGQTTSLVSIADDTRDILANSYMELQEINLNTQNTVKALATTNERLQRIENKL